MKPTTHLRHVWRLENDGNGDIKVLALQQWVCFDYGEGWWEDVPISRTEPDESPV